MKRHVFAASTLALLATAVAGAQSSDPNSSAGAPQDRVRGGYLQSNAPGVSIRQAIARHNDFQADRVIRARFGGDPNVSNESSSGSGSSSSSGGASSILDLINQFGGGDLGISSIGDLAGLVTGLTDLGGSTTTTGTSGTDASGSGPDTNSTGVDPRLQALFDLRDANIGSTDGTDSSSGTGTGSTLKSNQRSSSTREFGGAIAKLWKPEDSAQSTDGTTEDRSFKDRLLESWATAGFTAISVAFQTTQFVSVLEDGLRSIFRPKAGPGLVSLVESIAGALDALQSVIDNANSGADGDTGNDTGGDTGNDTGGNDTGGNDNTTAL
jgi:hypothetical protein